MNGLYGNGLHDCMTWKNAALPSCFGLGLTYKTPVPPGNCDKIMNKLLGVEGSPVSVHQSPFQSGGNVVKRGSVHHVKINL
ncbi:hypothetical protein T07_15111 [Trichinella nelsoni]|uniref:Uncharacterized protein n=1 Tax=Trichinella nelsoni TaxID=6336 RepID=A0A0V0RCH6_9BILA|nr:hypothetical protein T07_15111 [Trichinella nelsoni]